jgi:hypothetical protein
LAARYRRPKLNVDLTEPLSPERVLDWLVKEQITTLNVAGPRESSVRGIGRLAEEYLLQVLTHPLAASRLGLSDESNAAVSPASQETECDGA